MGLWTAIKRRLGRAADEEFFTPVLKEPTIVAKRFVLLVVVAELADSVALETAGGRDKAIEMRKRSLDYLVSLGWTPRDLESAEQRLALGLHTGKLDGNDALSAMWRLEGAGVLAWALGRQSAILPIDRHVDLPDLRAECPEDAAGFRRFAETAAVRPIHELMAARTEWSTRYFPIEHSLPSEERSRILERVRALRWLTESEQTELCATPVH